MFFGVEARAAIKSTLQVHPGQDPILGVNRSPFWHWMTKSASGMLREEVSPERKCDGCFFHDVLGSIELRPLPCVMTRGRVSGLDFSDARLGI